MEPKLTKLNRISMKSDNRLNERWLQEKLVAQPELLGLGDVVLRDKERMQPSGGRLDLLFSDEADETWYEIELQLGPVDESHIIRTLEYWDLERLRYQNRQHIAVIVAEEITARFFNVISLFNRFIPIVALQATAYEMTDGSVALTFTKVLDHRALEAPDEAVAAPADRQYWEARASTASLQFTDKLLQVLNNISETQQFTLNYNRAYIGLVNAASQTVMNLVYLRPRKKHVLVEAKCKQDSSLTELLDDSSLDFMDYRSKHGCYRFRVADVARLDEDAQGLVKLLLERALSENT
ncbi:MAG: hypothetical protein OXH86_19560 [Acidimicrobiaceae bacterium]|nr:hypothetical protein [Acidimicrobiaceae bacterium]